MADLFKCHRPFGDRCTDRSVSLLCPIYQEIMEFAKEPKELIGMLSKELYIMDKNMERLMVSQLQDEVTAAKAERDEVAAERDEAITKMEIFKLKCQNKTPKEIADKLSLSVEYVDSVLNEP